MTAPRPDAERHLPQSPDDVPTERLSAVQPAHHGSAPVAPARRPAGLPPLLGLVVLLGIAVVVVWLGSRLFTDPQPASSVPALAQPTAAAPAPITTAVPPPLTADGVTAAGIAEALKAPNPRDDSRNCTDLKLGCTHLMTTDAVSVYEWPDEAAAKRYAARSHVPADRVGRFVLQYSPDQRDVTDAKTRARYLKKARDLING